MYDRTVGERKLTFAFHPALYKSNLLLVDVETKSVWNQLEKRAISGPLEDTALRMIPYVQTTWGHWRSLHPTTTVAGVELRDLPAYHYRQPSASGEKRDSDPYQLVLGIEINGHAKVYPFSELEKIDSPITDRLGSASIQIHFDPQAPAAWATDPTGQPIPAITMYGGAWRTFHPGSSVFRGP